jgi:hypothetical protein
MPSVKRRREQYSDATRAAPLATTTALFAERETRESEYE